MANCFADSKPPATWLIDNDKRSAPIRITFPTVERGNVVANLSLVCFELFRVAFGDLIFFSTFGGLKALKIVEKDGRLCKLLMPIFLRQKFCPKVFLIFAFKNFKSPENHM